MRCPTVFESSLPRSTNGRKNLEALDAAISEVTGGIPGKLVRAPVEMLRLVTKIWNSTLLSRMCGGAFHGPHGYISPTWYATTGNVVPTSNFAVVHATGKLRPVEGQKDVNELLAWLISKFESYEGTDYDFTKIDDTYKYGMMSGIIGFELEIDYW